MRRRRSPLSRLIAIGLVAAMGVELAAATGAVMGVGAHCGAPLQFSPFTSQALSSYMTFQQRRPGLPGIQIVAVAAAALFMQACMLHPKVHTPIDFHPENISVSAEEDDLVQKWVHTYGSPIVQPLGLPANASVGTETILAAINAKFEDVTKFFMEQFRKGMPENQILDHLEVIALASPDKTATFISRHPELKRYYDQVKKRLEQLPNPRKDEKLPVPKTGIPQFFSMLGLAVAGTFAAGSKSGQRPKILLVDNNHNVLLFYREALERAGYAVVTASDGQEAFDQFEEIEFDGVVTDIWMPNVTGDELIEVIRASSPELTIIVIGADPSVELRNRLRADDKNTYFMPKSEFNQSQVAAKLQSLIPTRPLGGGSTGSWRTGRRWKRSFAWTETLIALASGMTVTLLTALAITYFEPKIVHMGVLVILNVTSVLLSAAASAAVYYLPHPASERSPYVFKRVIVTFLFGGFNSSIFILSRYGFWDMGFGLACIVLATGWITRAHLLHNRRATELPTRENLDDFLTRAGGMAPEEMESFVHDWLKDEAKHGLGWLLALYRMIPARPAASALADLKKRIFDDYLMPLPWLPLAGGDVPVYTFEEDANSFRARAKLVVSVSPQMDPRNLFPPAVHLEGDDWLLRTEIVRTGSSNSYSAMYREPPDAIETVLKPLEVFLRKKTPKFLEQPVILLDDDARRLVEDLEGRYGRPWLFAFAELFTDEVMGQAANDLRAAIPGLNLMAAGRAMVNMKLAACKLLLKYESDLMKPPAFASADAAVAGMILDLDDHISLARKISDPTRLDNPMTKLLEFVRDSVEENGVPPGISLSLLKKSAMLKRLLRRKAFRRRHGEVVEKIFQVNLDDVLRPWWKRWLDRWFGPRSGPPGDQSREAA